MSHTYTNLLYHVIFSTKDRRPFIDDELMPRLHGYVGGTATDIDCVPIQIGGVADHVHLLLKIPAKLSVSEVLRLLKCNSSGWVHAEFPRLKNLRGKRAMEHSRSVLRRNPKSYSTLPIKGNITAAVRSRTNS